MTELGQGAVKQAGIPAWVLAQFGPFLDGFIPYEECAEDYSSATELVPTDIEFGIDGEAPGMDLEELRRIAHPARDRR